MKYLCRFVDEMIISIDVGNNVEYDINDGWKARIKLMLSLY